jgi:hypothetical protein
MNTNRPKWASDKNRIAQRPKFERWYRPDDDGPIEGALIWRGEQEKPDGPQRIFCLQLEKGEVIGVNEYQQLRDIRTLPLGTRVYIEPKGKVPLPGARIMWEFDLFVDRAGDESPR